MFCVDDLITWSERQAKMFDNLSRVTERLQVGGLSIVPQGAISLNGDEVL